MQLKGSTILRPAKLTSRSIRIIAGNWRGSRVPVISEQGLRPTGDRIRETLFNWLTPHIVGAHCLDAFAGTGVLGLEALSRGAASVEAYELSAAAASSITTLSTKLGAEHYTLHQRSFFTSHIPSKSPYDIIFLDPPFDEELLQSAIDRIAEQELLAIGGLVYLEAPRARKLPQLPKDWLLIREKAAGDVCYGLAEKQRA